MSRHYKQHYKADDKFDEIYYKIFFSDGKILDIGCSTGNFLVQCKDGVGIDCDKEQLKIAKQRGLKVFYHDCNKKLPFHNNSFDGVNCRHVIEHLEHKNILPFMKEIKRILKPNGKLILMTPDVKRVKGEFWHDYTHKHPFNKKSLYKACFDAGFSKIDVYNFVQGFPAMRLLYERNLIKISSIKKIEKIAGKLYGKALLLEAVK